MDVRVQTGARLVAGSILTAVLLAGCSVGVPDPSAPKVEPQTSALATPTITQGHDAEAIAAQDMPFTAGGLLAKGVPVGISDDLKDAPGWTTIKQNVAGESQYLKADGCLVAAKIRGNQTPLALQDDRESTVGLFTYLDPSILPSYLKTATLRWGGETGKPGPTAEVLVLERPAVPGARATAVLARVFGTAASSAYISVACPDAGTLAAAQSDVVERLALVPPSN